MYVNVLFGFKRESAIDPSSDTHSLFGKSVLSIATAQ